MKFIVLAISLFIFHSTFAQIDSAEVYRQLFGEEEQFPSADEVNDADPPKKQPILEDADPKETDKGIPVFIALQPAVYFANNAMANYYNGSVRELVYENTYVIQTIWDNPNNKRIITEEMNFTDYQYDQIEFNESNFNYNMRYDIGFMIGFQAFFALKPRFQVMLDFNFVSLNTASVITLYVQDLTTPNQIASYMDVFGKEQRFIIDLGVHGLLGKRSLKYYLEGGPNFMMAKATDNFFTTGDEDGLQSTWNLMRTTNNTAANTITSFTVGAYAGAGLFFQMNENFAFEFGPQVSLNNIQFPGYSGYFTNIQVNLRIIYLSKNSEL
jgi:hypothetical protein